MGISELLAFAGPVVIIVLIISVILSIIFKGSSKTDKGFKIFYYKLSHRRKMIRSLTASPIMLLAMAVIYYFTNLSTLENILLGLFFLVLFTGEILYHFYMWKRKESNDGNTKNSESGV